MSFIPIKDAWDILKDVATGARKFRKRRRERKQREREDRAMKARQDALDIDELYAKEEQSLLASAQSLKEQPANPLIQEQIDEVEQRLKELRAERTLYYRVQREEITPQPIQQRMIALATQTRATSTHVTTQSQQKAPSTDS